jgi:hypothetical protein
MITYVFRYEHWVQAGFAGVMRHIAISGSMAALACAILVPASLRLGQQIKANFAKPFNLRPQFVPGSVLVVTLGLWIFSIVVYVL